MPTVRDRNIKKLRKMKQRAKIRTKAKMERLQAGTSPPQRVPLAPCQCGCVASSGGEHHVHCCTDPRFCPLLRRSLYTAGGKKRESVKESVSAPCEVAVETGIMEEEKGVLETAEGGGESGEGFEKVGGGESGEGENGGRGGGKRRAEKQGIRKRMKRVKIESKKEELESEKGAEFEEETEDGEVTGQKGSGEEEEKGEEEAGEEKSRQELDKILGRGINSVLLCSIHTHL